MDPVADMLAIIKNGYLARKQEVIVPFSTFKFEIAKALAKTEFIKDTKKEDGKIQITLSYEDRTPKMTNIKRVSKLGLRIYSKSKNIKRVKGGKGDVIISTPKGVMTGNEAKEKNLGGEVICEIW